ncbi:MAG: hypothetical protein ACJ8GN_12650 [Longimicrobiaceae bacterium]
MSAVLPRASEVVICRASQVIPLRVVGVPRIGRRDREWVLREVVPGADLLATSRLSGELRIEFARAGLAWIERETGLVHIDAPGLLIQWSTPAEQITRPVSARPVSLGGGASIVGELILAECRDRSFTLGELASRVKVTKARVSQILSALVAAGWLRAEGRTRSREYRLHDPASLLEAWVEQAAAPEHETGAYRWARTVESLYPRLTILNDLQVRWAVGGVAAAQIYEAPLSSAPIPTVWIEASVNVAEVASTLEAEMVAPGDSPNLLFWQSEGDPALQVAAAREPSWGKGLSLNVVSLPRAYAESRRAGGRSVDAAETLYEALVS